MIALESILPTVKTALEADAVLSGVPVIADLGYSDKAIETHLNTSGFCIALQPLLEWTPVLLDAGEPRLGPLYNTTTFLVRVWINPMQLERQESTISSGSSSYPIETTTGNVVMPSGGTIELYSFLKQVETAIVCISVGDETVREFTASGGMLAELTSGRMCYEVSFNVRVQTEY